MRVTASYLYSGMSDYFDGHGCDDNQALLYAYYGRDTTLHNIVDEWVHDSWLGAAGEVIPVEVTSDDVRAALLDMLSDVGRADYENGTLSEQAEEYCEEWSCCSESPITIVLIEWEIDK